MVFRVYVEKKEGLRQEADRLLSDFRELYQIRDLNSLRVLVRYDVEGLSKADFALAVRLVLSEPQLDNVYIPSEAGLRAGNNSNITGIDNITDVSGNAGDTDTKIAEFSAYREGAGNKTVFGVEYLPGQYDQRADSAEQCIQLLLAGERPRVRTAKIYILEGGISESELSEIKKYLINPVEARETDLSPRTSLDIPFSYPEDVPVIEGFLEADPGRLSGIISEKGLAMDLDDLLFCQEYFRKEGRNPSLTELRMIDTYWSDHCRHTTFLTDITDVRFSDEELRQAFERYKKVREILAKSGNSSTGNSDNAPGATSADNTGVVSGNSSGSKPINLMDIATISAKYLKATGKLKGLDESEEVNACTVNAEVDVDGRKEDWLLLFKNETHNHPTEIEPFGGAATCIGGAIRDPLSGRAYVYQAMRVSGAADPGVPVRETIPGKLPQRSIVRGAAEGYSSYGNQIGLATGIVEEIYHKGYAAKRLEVGAVVAAVPKENVKRLEPLPGDLVLLLGGRTGRDGIGGATGSSKAHKVDSLENCGAEVQKGNAPEERKLQRLFRNPAASRLIKRCNDFGAGGVSVAIGELADGLRIDLDTVPKKYEGLDGTELAISESQERMAVVVSRKDMPTFCQMAQEENLEVSCVAEVTEEKRLKMFWRENKILDISREFLSSNGAKKRISIECVGGESIQRIVRGSFSENYLNLVNDLNVCSQRGLLERFDSTIGAGTVLMPLGGKFQRTPIQAMVAKIPLIEGHTDTCSVMSYGFNPYIMEKNPYRGAYISVVESVCRLAATGAGENEIYLTLQEYFGKPGQDGKRWGQPLSALLGAFSAEMDLEVAAIGGKDSMSGSFEDLDVPPTLISFAITTENAKNIISPEYKAAGNRVLWLRPEREGELPKAASIRAMMTLIQRLSKEGRIASAYTPVYGGIAEAVFKQCIGNGYGFTFAPSLSLEDIFAYQYGSFLIELWEGETVDRIYAEEELKAAGVIVADLGTVTNEEQIKYNAEILEISDLIKIYESRLEGVYPSGTKSKSGHKENNDTACKDNDTICEDCEDNDNTCKDKDEGGIKSGVKTDWPHSRFQVSSPRVLIPVFPGTNCEYDSLRVCADAGLLPEVLVIKNLRPEEISESIEHIVKKLNKSQILFLPGGFSGGDEPDGSAKFITSFFRNPSVREAVTNLIELRDGLILGICNGFQALIKLGLLPFGKILDTDEHSPTLSYNLIGRHQSRIVRTKVTSNKSPWLKGVEPGEVYEVPISHGEGRFICEEGLYRELSENGQIALKYVDFSGKPTMDIDFNVNGSYYAVEGITSKDGRILGRMGHVERYQEGNFKNVPGRYDMHMFRSAREYFA